MSKIQPVVGRS